MAPPRKPRTADASILLHEQKRNIEVACLELQDELEEAGELDEEQIEARVDELRKKMTTELESGAASGAAYRGKGRDGKGGRREFKSHEVHEMAAQKEREMERLRSALGISKDYEEGSHWRRQEEDKERRMRNAAEGDDDGRRDRRYERTERRRSRSASPER